MSTQQWHVTIYSPAGVILLSEVAGIFDDGNKQRAAILGGPDGLTEYDIERAHQIVREHNSHEDLLGALEAWERWFRQGTKAPLYRSGEAIAKARKEEE